MNKEGAQRYSGDMEDQGMYFAKFERDICYGADVCAHSSQHKGPFLRKWGVGY